ncbi:hypothetical protein CPL00168_CDS0065 [Escherichia phage MatMar]
MPGALFQLFHAQRIIGISCLTVKLVSVICVYQVFRLIACVINHVWRGV